MYGFYLVSGQNMVQIIYVCDGRMATWNFHSKTSNIFLLLQKIGYMRFVLI